MCEPIPDGGLHQESFRGFDISDAPESAKMIATELEIRRAMLAQKWNVTVASLLSCTAGAGFERISIERPNRLYSRKLS